MPAVAGFLMEKELEFLGRAVHNPERPFAAVDCATIVPSGRYASSWSKPQSVGFLSSRHRRTLVPCRMRPSLT